MRFACWRWTPSKRPNPGIPACRWAWPTSPVALWTRHLRHNPANPRWPDRDRFVLSNGHGSMLQYALLHLSGYDAADRRVAPVPATRIRRRLDIRRSTSRRAWRRQRGRSARDSRMRVGMALAERLLAARFNRPGHAIVDHHTYVFVGDGCLMEGISHEACSLAGTLALGKLIVALRRQRHFDRRRRPPAGSPTTRRGASRRTAGTSCRASTATTSTPSATRSPPARRKPTDRR